MRPSCAVDVSRVGLIVLWALLHAFLHFAWERKDTWSAKQGEEEEERAGWGCAGEVQCSIRRCWKRCSQFFENTSGFNDQTVRQVEWGHRRRGGERQTAIITISLHQSVVHLT